MTDAAGQGIERTDQVWADEGCLMVRFDALGASVCITILDVSGREPKEMARATLGGWRFDRAVKCMRP
jgi:hypothetical protein